MPADVKQFELERIVNMLKSFGWDLQSSSFQDESVTATFKKVVKAEVPK